MGRKRGFFAELQHQARLSEQRQRQQQAANNKAWAAAHREAERARRDAERSQAAAARASAAEQKRLEAEAKRLYLESRQAEAQALSIEAENIHDEIRDILLATLSIDDYVDLETLRVFPPPMGFQHPELEIPVPVPVAISVPPEPVLQPPERVGAVGRMFNGKKQQELQQTAAAAHQEQLRHWQEYCAGIPILQARLTAEHQAAERSRKDRLGQAQEVYLQQLRGARAAFRAQNKNLDMLIFGLHCNREEAIQEYIGIVLSNSAYPESFPVEHDYEYESGTRELTLSVSVPAPSTFPTAKGFKYNRTKDEITETKMTIRDRGLLYADAIACTAVRTLHEVFEADRAERVATISLVVKTHAVDPATGLSRDVPLVAAAAERVTFLTFDLEHVEPLATLEYLKAAVSKNPLGLVPVAVNHDVRG
ncbi:hypothetical protein D1871_02965 [Nakamurella silvestris]|nr:hypothetical protein D1871_02965 [Nakamurella silvestris]